MTDEPEAVKGIKFAQPFTSVVRWWTGMGGAGPRAIVLVS